HPRRVQGDGEQTVLLPAGLLDAIRHVGEVVAAADVPLAVEQPRRQLVIVARRARRLRGVAPLPAGPHLNGERPLAVQILALPARLSLLQHPAAAANGLSHPSSNWL